MTTLSGRQAKLAAILDRHPEALSSLKELLDILREQSGGTIPVLIHDLKQALREATFAPEMKVSSV